VTWALTWKTADWLKLRDYMAWSWKHCGNWLSNNSNSDLQTFKAIQNKHFRQGSSVWSFEFDCPYGNSIYCVETYFLFIVMVSLTFDLKSNPKQALWSKKPCMKFEFYCPKETQLIVWKWNPDRLMNCITITPLIFDVGG